MCPNSASKAAKHDQDRARAPVGGKGDVGASGHEQGLSLAPQPAVALDDDVDASRPPVHPERAPDGSEDRGGAQPREERIHAGEPTAARDQRPTSDESKRSTPMARFIQPQPVVQFVLAKML